MKIVASLILFLSIFYDALAETSYTIIEDRCSQQNLDPPQATIRRAWGKKCFPQTKDYIDTPFFRNKYHLVYSPSQDSWNAPVDENAPCADWQLKAICLAACYTPDQRILFESGYFPIREALEQNITSVVVLQKNASFKNPVFQNLPVQSYSRSWQESHETIRVIQTQSGGQLKVTLNHPILLSSGIMIEASNLEVGDALVRYNGDFDPVISIQEIDYFGKVYNLSPKSLDPNENMIVAEGFLLGSGAYQFTEELHARIRTKNR